MTAQKSLPACLLLVAGLLATRVHAQTYSRSGEALLSRPAERAPSQLVGGRYTTGSYRSLQAPRQDIALLGENRFQFTRPERGQRNQRLRQVLPVVQQGFYNPLSPPGGYSLSTFADRTGEIAMISGLEAATSLYRGLPGYSGNLPALDTFRYSPKLDQTPFERYFGLTPAPREDALRPPAVDTTVMPTMYGAIEPTSYAAALESQVQRRVAAAAEDGLAAFRQGSREVRDPGTGRYPSCATCEQDLYRALQRLTVVREMDRTNYIAPLLMAHISLERERPTQAIVYLVNAFDRNPQLLAEGPEFLNAYFGDAEEGGGRSRVLQTQLRRYLRIGELNPGSADALALEAYCAWALGDRGRTRDACERFTSRAPSDLKVNPGLFAFIEAIEATVR